MTRLGWTSVSVLTEVAGQVCHRAGTSGYSASRSLEMVDRRAQRKSNNRVFTRGAAAQGNAMKIPRWRPIFEPSAGVAALKL